MKSESIQMHKKTDDSKDQLDALLNLRRKYERLPRAGWANNGSRSKTNHTVLVPREEVVRLASELYDNLYAKSVMLYENANLRHYLEQLAEGERDAKRCKECFGVYQSGWLSGKCPYCEAQAAAMSMMHEEARNK